MSNLDFEIKGQSHTSRSNFIDMEMAAFSEYFLLFFFFYFTEMDEKAFLKDVKIIIGQDQREQHR